MLTTIVRALALSLAATAVLSAAAAPSHEPSATRPSALGGACWKKPILPDWCQQ